LSSKGYNGSGAKTANNSDNSAIEVGLDILIYPNPTDGLINVYAPEGARLSLIDLNGRILQEKEQGATETQFDLSEFAQGVYLVEVRTGDGVHRQRVIKK
jgi:hypothetical protein